MSAPKLITTAQLRELSQEASRQPRLRKNLNLHPILDDPIQRMFNAMEPGTYVRPHRHARDNGWELMLLVKGAFSILIFDPAGRVVDRVDLNADRGSAAVEIPAHTWHSVVSLAPQTVMFEVKPGPYSPVEDKDFAQWAPPESSPDTTLFVQWFVNAKPGDTPPEMPRNPEHAPA